MKQGMIILCNSWKVFIFTVLFFIGCVTPPPPPQPGTGTLWGYVQLVPRKGVKPAKNGGSYGDHRFRDTEFVDYSQPGFAVVYLHDGTSPGGTARINIKSNRFGTKFDVEHTVVGKGGKVVLINTDSEEHVISCPQAEILSQLVPGDKLEIPANSLGVLNIFLLNVPEAKVTVFVSPGPYAVASTSGRWELRNLKPGGVTLYTHHPRFPSTRKDVQILPDKLQKIDIEIGVGNLKK